jgi:hypothetical protein
VAVGAEPAKGGTREFAKLKNENSNLLKLRNNKQIVKFYLFLLCILLCVVLSH